MIYIMITSGQPDLALQVVGLSRRGLPALQAAAESDDPGNQDSGLEEEHYLNPAFKFDEVDHKAVLREAENIDLVLKGERGNEVRPFPAARNSNTGAAATPPGLVLIPQG